MLRPRLAGARVLDLFAGSGAIAYELLSNGAANAVLVDCASSAFDIMNDNALRLGRTGSVRTILGDALQAVETLAQEHLSFDVIIVAPPYGRGLQQAAMDAVAQHAILNSDGVIIVQRDKRELSPLPCNRYRQVSIRSYGRTVFEFYTDATVPDFN